MMESFPALSPPPGVTSNFIDPPSRKLNLIVLESVFVPLMLQAVLVRIYVRGRITKRWEWDDYTCLVAACGSIVHMINHFQLFSLGFGRHLWDIRAIVLLNNGNNRKLAAGGIVYPVTIFCAKTSILLLYLRVFKVDRTIRHGVWVGIVFQALFYSAAFSLGVTAVCRCHDARALSRQFCIRYGKEVQVLILVGNIVTDIYVLVLPIHRVSKLQLQFKRKVGLMLVFAGGIVTCAVSLARLINFTLHYHSPDIFWIQATNAEFIIPEINIAIIIACVSTFPAFFNRTRSATSNFFSSLRSHLNSWRSTISLPISSILPDRTGKKDSKTEDSWQGDRTKLSDDGPYIPRNEVRGDEIELQSRTNSQTGASVDAERSLMERRGIVRTVNFGVEYSGNPNR